MLSIHEEGPVLRVTLNRPEVRNAINDEVIAELTQIFQGLASSVRVVVLGGEGKAFCAGGDLEWMRKASDYTEEENVQDAVRLGQLFEAIGTSKAVVISRVQGAAFGGGCGLVCASDIGIAARGSLFAFSEVRLGLVPGTISTWVIPKIGAGHARALFTTGEAFDADHALRIGLVHQVCDLDDLDHAVEEKVKAILRNGPHAVAISKQIAVEGPYPLDQAAQVLARARSSAEGREGVEAFLEKRPASFVVER